MKKIILIIVSIVFITIWTSCETYSDWRKEVEYSDAYPIAGEWYVNDFDATTGDTLRDSRDNVFDPYILYIYNKSFNPTKDSIWVDNKIGHPTGDAGKDYDFKFKIKCKANIENRTFDCDKQGDVGSNVNPSSRSNIVTITKSKVFVNSTSIEDATPDSIYLEILVVDSLGVEIGRIITNGHRKTGWEDPNYNDDM